MEKYSLWLRKKPGNLRNFFSYFVVTLTGLEAGFPRILEST